MRHHIASAFFLMLLCPAGHAAAQSSSRAAIDVTLIDAPYNVSFGGRAPSMRQSLDLTVSAHELVHGAIARSFGTRRTLGRWVSGLTDALTTMIVPLPLSDVWLHEEFHRAQMGRRGVGSFNDVYRMDIAAEAIAVSHVKDGDIVALKAAHPAEWVRTSSAGIEGESMLVRELQQRSFRGVSRGWHIPLYWFVKLGTTIYVASSTWPETDPEIDAWTAEEGPDIAPRDFTGHDMLSWVYDLHRPAESYAARGTHPSGVGIDRYVKLSDLTQKERRFIHRQGRLQLLNFVDPFLVGWEGARLRDGRITASLGHFLTASGYAIDANILMRRGSHAAQVIAHAYVNDAGTLPGIEATLFDRPARVAGQAVELTPRAAVWLQPKGLLFGATDASPGGLLALKVRSSGNARVRAFVELEAKSEGWVAGTPYLDAGISLRSGVTIR